VLVLVGIAYPGPGTMDVVSVLVVVVVGPE
jgi:hypothetical protein